MIKKDLPVLSLNNSTLRVRLAIFILIFTLVPSTIVFQATRYFITDFMINNNLDNYLDSIHNDIESNINALMYQVNMISLSIISEKQIYNTVMDQKLSTKQKNDQIKETLAKLLLNNDLFGDVIIITNDNNTYRYSDKLLKLEEPDSEFINRLTNSRLVVDDTVKKDTNGNSYLLFGKQFQYYDTSYKLGYLFLYLKESVLHATYENSILEQSSSFIVADDYIISHNNKSKIGSFLFDPEFLKLNQRKVTKKANTPYIVSKFDLAKVSLPVKWQLISVISYTHLYNAFSKIDKYVSIIQIVFIAISLFLSIYLSKIIAHPLFQLKNKMKTFGSGNTNIPLFKESKNELWLIEESFNTLVIQIKELLQKNNDEKEKKRIAELRALQAQINPHFIYNTLDAIGWIAKRKNQYDIESMIYALASFFRISLHKGEYMITVKEELEHIKSYITIEQMRFPNQFNVEFDIAYDILDCKIVKIILQPLVENAIKHGFFEIQHTGYIRVIGYKMDGDIHFEVIDNGKGFDTSTLSFDTPIMQGDKSGGYGVYNIQERLTLEYGENYGLSYTSKPGKGTRVEIRLKEID